MCGDLVLPSLSCGETCYARCAQRLFLHALKIVYYLVCGYNMFYFTIKFSVQKSRLDTMLSSKHHFPRQREDGQDKVYNGACKLE